MRVGHHNHLERVDGEDKKYPIPQHTQITQFEIDSRDRDTSLYPSGNYFKIPLGDQYKKICRISIKTIHMPVLAGTTEHHYFLTLKESKKHIHTPTNLPISDVFAIPPFTLNIPSTITGYSVAVTDKVIWEQRFDQYLEQLNELTLGVYIRSPAGPVLYGLANNTDVDQNWTMVVEIEHARG